MIYRDDKFIIKGGKPLFGHVEISGAKNAAVAIIPAALLSEEECVIDNLPAIKDVELLSEILRDMGADVEMKGNSMRIDSRGVSTFRAVNEKAARMRASYYLMGVLVGRFGEAEVSLPGGCRIGVRPMDQHIKGFEALKIQSEHRRDSYYLKAVDGRVIGGEVYLDVASVGATINIMLAAARADGNTVIVNAAKEPHVVDLANFLSAMGAKIKGAGTDIIRIKGVAKLHGCHYSIIPDQIEAGTMMIMAAATGGDVMINNVIPTHLEYITAKLIEAGATVDDSDDAVHVVGVERPNAISIKTLPYPGFPTDLQQPMTAFLSRGRGVSMINETIYEDRLQYVNELIKMGAKIDVVNNRVAVVQGVERLFGSTINALDLRAGAAMIIAGLIAEGETVVRCVRYIDRGYDGIEKKLSSLGADIIRVKDMELSDY